MPTCPHCQGSYQDGTVHVCPKGNAFRHSPAAQTSGPPTPPPPPSQPPVFPKKPATPPPIPLQALAKNQAAPPQNQPAPPPVSAPPLDPDDWEDEEKNPAEKKPPQLPPTVSIENGYVKAIADKIVSGEVEGSLRKVLLAGFIMLGLLISISASFLFFQSAKILNLAKEEKEEAKRLGLKGKVVVVKAQPAENEQLKHLRTTVSSLITQLSRKLLLDTKQAQTQASGFSELKQKIQALAKKVDGIQSSVLSLPVPKVLTEAQVKNIVSEATTGMATKESVAAAVRIALRSKGKIKVIRPTLKLTSTELTQLAKAVAAEMPVPRAKLNQVDKVQIALKVVAILKKQSQVGAKPSQAHVKQDQQSLVKAVVVALLKKLPKASNQAEIAKLRQELDQAKAKAMKLAQTIKAQEKKIAALKKRKPSTMAVAVAPRLRAQAKRPAKRKKSPSGKAKPGKKKKEKDPYGDW